MFVYLRLILGVYFFSLFSDSSKINTSFTQDDLCSSSKRDSFDRSSVESVNSSIEKNIFRGVEVKEEGLCCICYVSFITEQSILVCAHIYICASK